MRHALAALLCFLLCAPALAVTGNAPPATGWAARPIVMVVDPQGDLCTGTALAPDLVLTGAHCIAGKKGYEIKPYQTGVPIKVLSAALHPQFNAANYAAARATADVALIKLATPLPDIVVPATLAAARRVAVGEKLTIAGFGVTADRTDRGLGQPRMAQLTVTGQPSSLQVRLYDDATRNKRTGLGSCAGDSGGPAFDGEGPQGTGNVIGVISWATAPNNEGGCGGLTGVTPLLNYRAWIIETAKKLGATVAP
jgi:secreted trypsin-like serine protease